MMITIMNVIALRRCQLNCGWPVPAPYDADDVAGNGDNDCDDDDAEGDDLWCQLTDTEPKILPAPDDDYDDDDDVIKMMMMIIS